MGKTTFNIPSMSCVSCSSKIKNGLMEMNGVENVSIDLKSQNVTVDYNSQDIEPEDILKCVKDMGYEVIE